MEPSPGTPHGSLLLVCDRDPALRRLLVQRFTRAGYDVTDYDDPRRVAEKLDAVDPRLLVVELGDELAFDPLLLVREVSQVPTIGMLWADPDNDEATALELGADDCLRRPFSLRHLVARTHAVLRRSAPLPLTRLRFPRLVIDLASHTVHLDGRLVDLAAREFELLVFMAAQPGVAFTREELLTEVWKSSAEWQQRETVTEHIHRLRTRLEADPTQPVMLLTVRGVGYRFVAPEDSSES